MKLAQLGSPKLDAATLEAVMVDPNVPRHLQPTRATYEAYLPYFNDALIAANCTTVRRIAMFCAQIGHESAGLKYMEEIATGAAYEGRKDLGNTFKGDGRLFKGRGPIQLTGRHNYGIFSRWCHERGIVPTADWFIGNPEQVATPQYGFLAASWYWTVARPDINALADAGDLVTVTRRINGGTRGLDDRRRRWNRALAFDDKLLPPEVQEIDLTPEEHDMLQETRDLLRWVWSQVAGENAKPFEFTGWPSFPGGSGKDLTVVDYVRTQDVEIQDIKRQLAQIEAKLDGV